jgi:hypothetical protein
MLQLAVLSMMMMMMMMMLAEVVAAAGSVAMQPSDWRVHCCMLFDIRP